MTMNSSALSGLYLASGQVVQASTSGYTVWCWKQFTHLLTRAGVVVMQFHRILQQRSPRSSSTRVSRTVRKCCFVCDYRVQGQFAGIQLGAVGTEHRRGNRPDIYSSLHSADAFVGGFNCSTLWKLE